MRRLTAALLTALCLATPATARAQSPGSGPLFDQLTHTFKRDWLSVGLLLQIVADGQIERTMPGQNGFSVANARLGLSGRLDGGFSYALQTALTRSPAILDAKLGYRLGSWGTVEVGRFKAPFSRERLTSAAGIDFVNRSQVVTALSPGRQVGAQLLGRLLHGRLEYGAGAFNGNGLASGNDNQHLMYTGRVSWWAYGDPAAGPADRRLEIAVNAAGSRDDAAAIGGVVPSFRATAPCSAPTPAGAAAACCWPAKSSAPRSIRWAAAATARWAGTPPPAGTCGRPRSCWRAGTPCDPTVSDRAPTGWCWG